MKKKWRLGERRGGEGGRRRKTGKEVEEDKRPPARRLWVFDFFVRWQTGNILMVVYVCIVWRLALFLYVC